MKNNSLLKGSLATIVLKLLEDGSRMYGYEITQRVKSLTEGQIQLTEGALYPTLHKLEAEGLLSTETEVVDGRARKYYHLTPDGETATTERLSEAASFLNSLQLILNPKLS